MFYNKIIVSNICFGVQLLLTLQIKLNRTCIMFKDWQQHHHEIFRMKKYCP